MNNLMYFHQEQELRETYTDIAIRSVFYEALCKLIYNGDQGKVKVAYDCLLYPHVFKEKEEEESVYGQFKFHDMNFLCNVVNLEARKAFMQKAESYDAVGAFVFYFLNIGASNKEKSGRNTSSQEETAKEVFESGRKNKIISKSVGHYDNFRKNHLSKLKFFSPIIYSIYFLTSASLQAPSRDSESIKEFMSSCFEWEVDTIARCLSMAVGCRNDLLKCDSRNTKGKESIFQKSNLIDFSTYISPSSSFTFPMIHLVHPHI